MASRGVFGVTLESGHQKQVVELDLERLREALVDAAVSREVVWQPELAEAEEGDAREAETQALFAFGNFLDRVCSTQAKEGATRSTQRADSLTPPR